MNALGGVCLNEGCIPSKALLYSAKVYDYALHGEKYGVKTEGASLDHKAVVARRGKVVRTLVSGVGAKMKGRGRHRRRRSAPASWAAWKAATKWKPTGQTVPGQAPADRHRFRPLPFRPSPA